jgi:ABC-type lipoprotein export system ATPase subunit
MKNPLIKIENVYKEYKIDSGIFVALDNVSVEISKSEYVAILGPSGSGKSTLMHIIGLLDSPTRGKVLIEGEDISNFSDDKLSHLRNEFVGFVFQQFNLINKLTVLENVLLPTMYTRNDKGQNFIEKANDLLKRFGILEKAKSYPNKLSGGQQQRVAIARALVNDPQLILADEPTGNLDTKTGNIIMDLLDNLNSKDKITVVLVTHEKDIADRARRRIIIRDGKVSK